ncbi:uncharacterized protein LY89DRAFT_759070 [Mollisia scopiformis]|uniref:Uncharacterized protein n=1 Tax=Mollisia scopiformis TaxID=149040 RepID=A0A194WTE6_MOLSC|nr:uncharacterized protein LY89DRAFT_759070 [Mollisia scopiformis]KUJ11236.1 hypothetical protein LY89DRAFT_759070 [Mollisia scopiformis]
MEYTTLSADANSPLVEPYYKCYWYFGKWSAVFLCDASDDPIRNSFINFKLIEANEHLRNDLGAQADSVFGLIFVDTLDDGDDPFLYWRKDCRLAGGLQTTICGWAKRYSALEQRLSMMEKNKLRMRTEYIDMGDAESEGADKDEDRRGDD